MVQKWPTKKLGDYIQEKKEKNKKGIDLPVYSISNIYGFIHSEELFYKKVYSKSLRNYKIVEKGDFAYNPARINVGSIGLFDKEDRVLVSPMYTVFKIIDKNSLDPKFLFLLFKTDKYSKLIKNTADSRGSVRKILSYDDLVNFLIPLPPLPIQQKIVKILDTIQEAVDIQEKIIEKTKELKKSLMNLLFHYGVAGLRVKELMSSRVGELTSSEIEKFGIKLKKTEIGEIPEDWGVISFSKSLDINFRFKVGELKQRDYQKDGEYPIIDQGEKLIAGYSEDYDKVYQGDLPVVIFGDHTRVVKYVDFPFIVGGGGVKILKPNDNFDIKYFYYLLLNLDIESRGYNRHFGILKDKLIPLPPLPEQQEIAEILQTIDQKIEIERRKKELYEELFKAMLNNIMSQRIDINNIGL